MKSLDQVNHPAGACASYRALKLQNNRTQGQSEGTSLRNKRPAEDTHSDTLIHRRPGVGTRQNRDTDLSCLRRSWDYSRQGEVGWQHDDNRIWGWHGKEVNWRAFLRKTVVCEQSTCLHTGSWGICATPLVYRKHALEPGCQSPARQNQTQIDESCPQSWHHPENSLLSIFNMERPS